MNSISIFTSEILHVLLYWLASHLPKDKDKWSIGAWYGNSYNDNPKYIFEYVSQHEKQIDIAWITRNKEVRTFIRSRGYKAYLLSEPRGILHMLTSSVALFCQTKQHDLSGACIGPKTKLIQLWHGFSFKKYLGTNPIRMPLDREVAPLFEIIILFLASQLLRKKYSSLNDLPYRNEYWESYHLICAKSPRHKQKFLDIIPSLDPNKIVVAEYPRSDAFFNKTYTSPFIKKLEELRSKGEKIGIFMPTFRSRGHSVPEVFIPGIEMFAAYCKQNNIHMFIKLHRNDTSHFVNSTFQIITQEDIEWDIYPVLPHTDFLLTDYSSIYSDYPLLNKPIVFVPFDKNEYQLNRGLYPDYERLIAGRSAKNWSEVIQHLKNLNLKSQTTHRMQHSYTEHLFATLSSQLISSV